MGFNVHVLVLAVRRHGIGIGVFESCGQSIAKLYYLEARVKEGGKGKITVECGQY